MPIIQPVHEIEASSATVKISDDGRSAVIAIVFGAPDSGHYRVTMKRQLFDRLALQMTREKARVPKPPRARKAEGG
jgi:uncharacterized protein YigA (DUF484 family)